jgi:hypothetical protein
MEQIVTRLDRNIDSLVQQEPTVVIQLTKFVKLIQEAFESL